MTGRVQVLVEDAGWKEHRGLVRKITRAAELTLVRGAPGSANGEVVVLLTKNARLRTLNAHFRGKDAPTNVLAFPASKGGRARNVAHDGGRRAYLGDVALAYGVARREAREAQKSLSDHAQHLAVHGVLHLLGFEHETERGARRMEGLEASLLKMLGVDNPYVVRTNAP